MPLRRVLLRTSSLGNNQVSFVNQTARRLHIRKTVGTAHANSAVAVGDLAEGSLDEVPVTQERTNDSRSHIDNMAFGVGATGDLVGSRTRAVLSFNRNDLFLDPDEAIFLNTVDTVGSPPVNWLWNIWYED